MAGHRVRCTVHRPAPPRRGHARRWLGQLLAAAATIIVIDHDLDLLAATEHVTDMGPGGGLDGGRIVAAAQQKCGSVTGPWLAEHLGPPTPARCPASTTRESP